jgi:hypothetical protein
MRSDSDIKRDVEDGLRWTPDLDPTDIGVAVKNGVVTLTGFVRSYRPTRSPLGRSLMTLACSRPRMCAPARSSVAPRPLARERWQSSRWHRGFDHPRKPHARIATSGDPCSAKTVPSLALTLGRAPPSRDGCQTVLAPRKWRTRLSGRARRTRRRRSPPQRHCGRQSPGGASPRRGSRRGA